VLTVHPTLLIGPSDWDAERMPREEFLRRLEALWQTSPSASHAVVYGDSRHHAELAYLTNVTPKLDAVIALLSRSGEHRLFVGGGPNMLAAARPLTWIADVLPLKDVGDAIRASAAPGRALILIGGGYMPAAHHRTVTEAIGERGVADATATVWTLMRRKTEVERQAVRHACAALTAAMTAIRDAQRAGADVTAAVLAGERAANACGAQDVRTLFSLNRGRTLQPFTALIERPVDPLQVYVAVRRFGYWAEGFALLSERPVAAAEKAGGLVRSALAAIKPGTRADELARRIAAEIHPYRAHPVTAGSFAHSIGLALEEPPYTDLGVAFEAGETYSLRIGVTDEVEHAIASAMVAVGDAHSDVLWPAIH
jgi:Xaa-Pro aminopeptidase